jgi:hypothetical protein
LSAESGITLQFIYPHSIPPCLAKAPDRTSLSTHAACEPLPQSLNRTTPYEACSTRHLIDQSLPSHDNGEISRRSENLKSELFLHIKHRSHLQFYCTIMSFIKPTIEPSELLRAKGHYCPPNDICDTYPCRHTPCLDLDYLEDHHDQLFNHDHWDNIWWFWHLPEERNSIPDSEREIYEAKFHRCQRLFNKLHQTRFEINVNKWKMRGVDPSVILMDAYVPYPELEEANRPYIEELKSRRKNRRF